MACGCGRRKSDQRTSVQAAAAQDQETRQQAAQEVRERIAAGGPSTPQQ